MSNYGTTLAATLIVTAASFAAAPPLLSDPLKAVVVGEKVVNFVLDEGIVEAHVHSLRKDENAHVRACALCNLSPLRWQLGQGSVWVSEDLRLSWGRLDTGGTPGPLRVAGVFRQEREVVVS